LLRRGVEVLGDEDGDDERVDGEDTGHDDRDEALLCRAAGSQLAARKKQATAISGPGGGRH
jgi:hypothetical protein